MSETVSKTKGATSTGVEDVEVVGVAKPKRSTNTNWAVLSEGGFIPVQVRCEGYRGSHPSDQSCRTNLIPTGENVIRHMNPDHGGGWFKVKFRISDSGKRHPLWDELAEGGVEIQDFYCPHCREQVQLISRRIIQHLQNHVGANRVNMEPQTLCFELGYRKPDQAEVDALYGD